MCFLRASGLEVAIIVVGWGRGFTLILRLFAPVASRRYWLLAAILFVRIALIASALGAVGIMPVSGRSRFAREKIVTSRTLEAEMRRLGLIGRRWRSVGAPGRFRRTRRIIPLNGVRIVTLGLRKRRIGLIRIGMAAEVGITAALLLSVPPPLVLIEIRNSPFVR
jgi:hypothetical protein